MSGEKASRKQSFLQGVAVLTAATIIVKLLGFIYKVPLQNILQERGFGYFNTAYDVYNVLLMISTTGLPVAVSRMISQAQALENYAQIRKIYSVSMKVFLTIGVIGTLVMLVFCKPLSVMVTTNENSWAAIAALSPCVLLICIVSAHRGFFQGQSNMTPTSVSQVYEAMIRVVFGLGGAYLMLKKTGSLIYAAAGGIFGVTAGCIVAVVYLRIQFGKSNQILRQGGGEAKSTRQTMKELLVIAIPITLGSAGLQIINLFDTMIYMRRLTGALAWSSDAADTAKGIYNFCQTIFNLPCSLITPITISIIPTVTAALTKNNAAGARHTEESAVRTMSLIAMPCAVGLAVLGLVLGLRSPANSAIYAREGLVIVALAWVLMSVFGALPFIISGDIPFFVDAFFETVSGFTTTGSSILRDVEAMSYSMLFWRSFTHWVGGMGVLVFTMAVLPVSDGRAMHLMRAESPGPSVGKISSKIRDTAKILYAMYLVLTVVQTILLRLVGLPWYDALITAFGAAGTGGFSNRAASIGAYGSPAVEMITAVFMVLFGINFNVYFFLLIRHFKEAFACEEMRVYLGVIAASTLAVAGNIFHLYGNVWQSLRYSFFQVASIITTTGYATTDFNMWPTFSKAVLVLLMFFGACAGSTGGGIKISRIIIMCKTAKQDLMRVLHPHAVTTVRFEGKPLDDKTVFGVRTYMNLYLIIFVLSTMVVAINQFDLVTTFTAVASCLNNIGPGLELVGPMVSFADFSPLIKLVLSFDMLVGRLEIFPMLVLFAPSTWLRSKGHLDRRLRARNLF